MYGKHFASTYTGSMVGAGAGVFAVWGYVIAHVVKSRVELNPNLIAAILGMSKPDVISSIDVLSSPDPSSRNPEHEGKRIVREGQFQYFVPTHEHYNGIRNQDERRNYNKIKKREERARKSNVKEHVVDMSAVSAYTDADADADESKIFVSPSSKLEKSPVVGEFVQVTPVKGKPKKEMTANKQLVIHFHNILSEKHGGGKATIAWQKCVAAAKRVLKNNSLDELKALAYDFFEMTKADYWHFTHFCSTIDNLKCRITYEREHDPLATVRGDA